MPNVEQEPHNMKHPTAPGPLGYTPAAPRNPGEVGATGPDGEEEVTIEPADERDIDDGSRPVLPSDQAMGFQAEDVLDDECIPCHQEAEIRQTLNNGYGDRNGKGKGRTDDLRAVDLQEIDDHGGFYHHKIDMQFLAISGGR